MLRFCKDGDVGRDVSLEMSVTQALMLAGTPASFFRPVGLLMSVESYEGPFVVRQNHLIGQKRIGRLCLVWTNLK